MGLATGEGIWGGSCDLAPGAHRLPPVVSGSGLVGEKGLSKSRALNWSVVRASKPLEPAPCTCLRDMASASTLLFFSSLE